jgi:integral membrane sensor domain MASE1
MKRNIPTPVAVALVAVIYFLLGKLGVSLAFFTGSAAAMYPAGGFALAMILLCGRRIWLGILAGSLVLDCTNLGLTPNLLAIFLNSGGNTFALLIGAALIDRLAGGSNAMRQPVDILKFVLLAGALTPLISATFTAASLAGTGAVNWNQMGALWLSCWLGSAISNLIVAPLILVWAGEPLRALKRAQLFEAIILLSLLFVLGAVVFGGLIWENNRYPLSHLLIPVLLWAGFRFGQRGAPVVAFVVAAIAMW